MAAKWEEFKPGMKVVRLSNVVYGKDAGTIIMKSNTQINIRWVNSGIGAYTRRFYEENERLFEPADFEQPDDDWLDKLQLDP